jgi:hypothetical protein
MKTKLILSILLGGALVASAFAAGRGNGNGPGNGPRGLANGMAVCDAANCPRVCDMSGPGQGTPRRDGSGKLLRGRGNPNSTGTPLRDGSGRATAPGRGPKDGSGNRAGCPLAPQN